MRRGDADAEAQPAAPPSEFSSSLRAEVFILLDLLSAPTI